MSKDKLAPRLSTIVLEGAEGRGFFAGPNGADAEREAKARLAALLTTLTQEPQQ